MKVVAGDAFRPSLRRGVQAAQKQDRDEPEGQVANDRREQDLLEVELPGSQFLR
jgi:hypothetical protein